MSNRILAVSPRAHIGNARPLRLRFGKRGADQADVTFIANRQRKEPFAAPFSEPVKVGHRHRRPRKKGIDPCTFELLNEPLDPRRLRRLHEAKYGIPAGTIRPLIAGSSNGRTAVFDAARLGSNPSPAANSFP